MIKRILNYPIIYKLSQKFFLADDFRKKILQQKVKEKNLNVLDIGCGPGNMVKYLKFNKYYGFDIDSNYINYAKKKYRNCFFFCEKFSKKSLKKIIKVDLVILFGILHHISDKQTLDLLEIIKFAIKKKSKIIILDPVFIKNQNKFAKFLIRHDRGKFVRDIKNYLKLYKIKKFNFSYKIYHQKTIPYTWMVTELKK